MCWWSRWYEEGLTGRTSRWVQRTARPKWSEWKEGDRRHRVRKKRGAVWGHSVQQVNASQLLAERRWWYQPIRLLGNGIGNGILSREKVEFAFDHNRTNKRRRCCKRQTCASVGHNRHCQSKMDQNFCARLVEQYLLFKIIRSLKNHSFGWNCKAKLGNGTEKGKHWNKLHSLTESAKRSTELWCMPNCGQCK